jgi:hypothetical protein
MIKVAVAENILFGCERKNYDQIEKNIKVAHTHYYKQAR